MALFVKNASQVLTMKRGLGLIRNASIFIENGKISRIGKLRKTVNKVRVIDAEGKVICPGFVDSHTHLVFGGSRENEFAQRVQGISYEKIAKKGGGIAYSVRMTESTSEEDLYREGMAWIQKIIRHGTTTIEIKSGYGLSMDNELKMLRVINRIKKDSVLDIVATYLVHAIPKGVKRETYVEQVIEQILPAVVYKKLARFCDIFCDKLAFTKNESDRVLKKAQKLGLDLKIHADQFARTGAARLAAKLGCTSADHLEYSTSADFKEMKKAGVIPVLLPGVTLYLQFPKVPNIVAIRKAKIPVALASDFNPGSCTIYAMPKIIFFACILYGLSVEEALIGATKYGAQALNLYQQLGSIEIGKQADLVVFDVDSYKKIPYYFGEDMVQYTIKKGRIIYGKNC